MLVTAHNRGPDPATLHLLPTLWFRNTWSWGDDGRQADDRGASTAAGARRGAAPRTTSSASGCSAPTRPRRCCSARTRPTTSACSATPNASPYVKDGINDFVVDGDADAVNPERTGHQGGRAPRARARAGAERSGPPPSDRPAPPAAPGRTPLGADVRRVLERAAGPRPTTFYATVIPPTLSADQAMVMRQALAGLLWGKQYYEYDVHRWLREHGVDPWDPTRRPARSATCRGST